VQRDRHPQVPASLNSLAGASETPDVNRFTFLAVALIDVSHAGGHPTAVTENPFASFPATAMLRTHDFGLCGGGDQNEQACDRNRLHR
jgi:hypothetical protein